MLTIKKGSPQQTNKLYAILADLDRELQMLGVRPDLGRTDPMNPIFARRTLVACLALLSYLAPKSAAVDDAVNSIGYLESAAQFLLDIAVRRKIVTNGNRTGDIVEKENRANEVRFAKLVRDYVAGFQDAMEE